MRSLLSDDIFDSFFGTNLSTRVSTGSIELELPGVRRDELAVEILNDIMTVRWKDRSGTERAKRFAVDGSRDPRATLVDGILRIETSAPPGTPRKIPVG